MEDLTVRQLWDRLNVYLAQLGEVHETPLGLKIVAKGGSEGPPATTEIVVTPEEWDDYVSTIYGTGDPSATPIRGRVLDALGHKPYLIYDGTYDWAAGDEPELPADVEPDVQGGRWFVVDGDGRKHYFSDDSG
ncbi:hypothetical protein KVF89_21250 [Nocardioides carbamazepini]|uniref:hypothetical protein n=1 Tax=Nocardioides carbamazepini TaxID=2854259 RepID=UPI00214A301C|nr:hypothetical protein [Nocardioides carbamazepini]MCR1785079.1 hypothetical protein [Nocardioides carbamazepini]